MDLITKTLLERFSSMRAQYDSKVLEEIKNKLSEIGISFDDDADFFSFCKQRITRVDIIQSKEVHYHLDFIDSKRPGQLLCISKENQYSIERYGVYGYKISIG